MGKAAPASSFAPGPKVPAVIQRLAGKGVEWLCVDDPPEWTTDSAEAFVFPDIIKADIRARELAQQIGQICFPAVRERVRKPAPFFSTIHDPAPREGAARVDWREHAPNCGVE